METQFVVIGGGIVGTAIALELRQRGADVALVERGTEPQGASAASFASLSAFDEPARDVYLLKSLGMVGWRSWAKRYGDDLGARWDGEIRWAETPDEARHIQNLIGRAAGRGYPVRSISAAELHRRLPGAAPATVLAASYAGEDGQADPLRAIQILRQELVSAGGVVVAGRANLVFDEGTVDVHVGEERIHCKRVVVATGAETGMLLEKLGWDIPMEPSPGLLAYTKPVDRMMTGTVYATTEEGVTTHLRQLVDGRVVVGEGTQDHVAADPTPKHALELLGRAARSFPALATADLDHYSIEWRPRPRDGMPIVGPLPGFPLVYVAAMHSGVTLAPAVGDLVAQELVDAAPSTRLASFRPGRFGDHSADAYRSVEEAFSAPAELYLG